jgi:hypothetical protein
MVYKILSVQGPIQFIAGYISLMWELSYLNKSEKYEIAIVMHDFLSEDNAVRNMKSVVFKLAITLGESNIKILDHDVLASLSKLRYSKRLVEIRKFLELETVDLIVISRDFCGLGNLLLLNSYPSAKKITYGDSLGLVGNFVSEFGESKPLLSFLRRVKKILVNLIKGSGDQIKFNSAILVLPLDWSGTYLKEMPLFVPDKNFVTKIFNKCTDVLNSEEKYKNLCDEFKIHGKLFLLSNLSQSGLCSEENEIRLYEEIIRKSCSLDDCIYIKPHPRAPFRIIEGLICRLSKTNKIYSLSHPDLDGYPVELWTFFLKNNLIFPIYSTSSINFKYLYDIDVKFSLNQDVISKYIYPTKKNEVYKNHLKIINSIEKMTGWDGINPILLDMTC